MWEYFRGSYEDNWPVLSVCVDKSFISPEHYRVRVALGSSQCSPTREEVDAFVDAYNQAEQRLKELQQGA